jgi:membrane protein
MFKRTWTFLRDIAVEWNEDQVMLHSAAVAYYAVFSLPPFLVLLIWIADPFMIDAGGELFGRVGELMSPQIATTLESVFVNARIVSDAGWAKVAGIIALIFGSTGIYRSLYFAMNRILRSGPARYDGWTHRLQRYVISGLLLIGTALLLPVLVAASSLVDIFDERLSRIASIPTGTLALTNNVFTAIIIMLLLMGLYTALPRQRPRPSSVFTASIVTTLLFLAGKYMLAAYIDHANVGSTYGVAASILVLLLWIYYCAHMFLVGGEIIDFLQRPKRTRKGTRR